MFAKIFVLVLFPVLIYSTYTAFHWGVADAYSRTPINKIKKSIKGNLLNNKEEWNAVDKNLSIALEHNSSNPELHEYIGFAKEGPFINYSFGNEVASESRKTAYVHYRQAILLRPIWPHTWVRLAVIKYRMNEIDEDFFHALHQADDYGPWIPEIQKSITGLGILNWNKMNNDEKKFIAGVIAKGIIHGNEKHASYILNITKTYGLMNQVCELTKSKEVLIEYCNEDA